MLLMRKFIVIILSGTYLFANTEVAELFKIPQLVSHYFQHHRQNPDMSFVKFIAEHYGGDDGTTADDDQDSKLPCHDVQHHNTFSSLFFSMDTKAPSFELPAFNKKNYSDRLLVNNPSKHVVLVLQPPRGA